MKSLIREYPVYSPVKKTNNFTKESDYSFKKVSLDEEIILSPYRCVEPLKSFFTQAKEQVAEYFKEGEEDKVQTVIIFGIKSCDLSAHKIQDYVFLEGAEVDSLYSLRRKNTIFISNDCTDFKSVCHCLAWEILPYPTFGFDLNLSPLNEGFVVETGSEKGEEIIKKYNQFFVPAKDVQIMARMAKRLSLIDRLRRHLLPQNLVKSDTVQKLVKDGYSLDTWSKFMSTCVECGGCNFICDTCHCFLLSEKKERFTNHKIRSWDSCQYANYAKVAGGANPLKTRAQRLRFRFTKKFDFFVDNLGVPACCGCGRCIEVCPGKIDIREVLKDLALKLKIK